MEKKQQQQQLVVKDNALINAAYRLELTEQRLILMSTVRARESGQGISTDRPLTVRAEDYAEQFGVTRQAAYMALKEATAGLFERQFTYGQLTKRGNREVVKSRWVSRVSYIESEGRVSIVFAPDVVHLITRLEKEFTRYDLRQVSGLKSTYAVRLYEMLISWRRLGQTPEIELSEFRQQLGVIDDEYLDMQNFKRRVLDLAVRQINEHTDLAVNYTQHKRGRRITGFSFKFKIKKTEQDLQQSSKRQPRQPPEKRAIYGIPMSIIEQKALPGETAEQVAERLLYEAKRKGVKK